MAYQNIGTPRFYINVIEWLMQNGLVTNAEVGSLFRTLPVNTNLHEISSISLPSFSQILTDQSFIAVLGHTYGNDTDHYFRLENIDDYTEIINYTPNYNGFSIATFLYNDLELSFINEPTDASVGIGSILVGTYYDMPHSPELSLTMTREMDGVKRVRTRGGSDLVKHQYIRSPKWGDLAPWELWGNNYLIEDVSDLTSISPKNQDLARVGRRTWDLSFNYLQDSDIFPDLSNVGWEGTYENDYDSIGNTLLDDDTFFSLIHKTNGGQLPFIFQPDKDNFNIDDFAICKFDMDTFEFEQVANGIYNIKLKIREVW